jgi:hypothetical protein
MGPGRQARRYRKRPGAKAKLYAYHKAWVARPGRREKHEHSPAERAARRHQAQRAADPLGFLLRNAKGLALKKGIVFAVTAADFPDGIPATCPTLGVKMDMSRSGSPNAPSLGRVDPSKGFVRGNVEIICKRANWANMVKADCWEPAELRAIAAYIEGRRI